MNRQTLLAKLSEPKTAVVVLLVFSIALRVLLAFAQPAVVWPDSNAYYKFALAIAQERDFNDYPIYRTPLYSIFLSLFLHQSDSHFVGDLILYSQQALGVLTVIAVYFLALRLSSPLKALAAALIYSTHLLAIYYELTIQTEAIFSPLLYLSLLLMFNFIAKPELRAAAILGLSLGFLALARPIGQLLPLLLIPCLFLNGLPLKQIVKSSLLLFAVMFSVMLPWLYWNKTQKGIFALSRELGINAYHRVIDSDGLRADPGDLPENMNKILSRHLDKVKPTYFYVWHDLARAKISEKEADDLMLKAALSALKTGWPVYLKNTGLIFFKYFFASRPSPALCGSEQDNYFCTERPAKHLKTFNRRSEQEAPLSSQLRSALFNYLQIPPALLSSLALLGVLALIRKKQANIYLLLSLGVMFYFATLTSVFNLEEDRFRLPIDPLLIILAVEGLSYLSKPLYRAEKLD